MFLDALKKQFVANVRGLYQVKKIFKHKKTETTESYDISINAFQIGGKPERLSGILKGEKGYGFLKCSKENIEECSSIIE